MQALAHAVDGAVPWFEQFGVGQGLFAAAENFGLLSGGQFVVIFALAEPGAAMFLKPNSKPPPFLGSEGKDGRFNLFQAHARKCICGGAGCKPAVREAESLKSASSPVGFRRVFHARSKGWVELALFRALTTLQP